MKLRSSLALALLGVAFAAAPAQAAFINGSISLADGFISPYSFVSTSTSFDIDSAGSINSPNTDFDIYLNGGDPFADAGVVNTAAPGGTLFTAGGFTFTLTGATIASTTGMACVSSSCADGRNVLVSGTITGNGFDPTAFEGLFSSNGGCTGTAGACTGAYSASWSMSLSALGRTVPEPGSLALLGFGLLGLGAARRRKA